MCSCRDKCSANRKESTEVLSAADRGIHLVLLGAPGAGKGTQAKHLSAKYGLAHISSGNLLRDELTRGTKLAAEIKGYMDKGQLVPDSIIIDLIINHVKGLESPNWMLDGFPRTASQAKALKAAKELYLTHIIELQVDQEAVVKRLGGRRFDPTTGNTYHVDFDPPPADIADRVIIRDDDKEEVIRERFVIYEKNKKLIADTFGDAVTVVSCEGLSIEEVSARVDAVIDGRQE